MRCSPRARCRSMLPTRAPARRKRPRSTANRATPAYQLWPVAFSSRCSRRLATRRRRWRTLQRHSGGLLRGRDLQGRRAGLGARHASAIRTDRDSPRFLDRADVVRSARARCLRPPPRPRPRIRHRLACDHAALPAVDRRECPSRGVAAGLRLRFGNSRDCRGKARCASGGRNRYRSAGGARKRGKCPHQRSRCHVRSARCTYPAGVRHGGREHPGQSAGAARAGTAARVRSGGRIVLSGILEPQSDAVAAAYAPWFNIAASQCADGWVLLTGDRRAPTLS